MHNSSRINQEIIKENALLKQRIQELELSAAEHKRVEESLRASGVRYQTIFETTGTAMLIVEEDKTISLANLGFESLTGYTRKEVEGKRKWTEFVAKDDLRKMIAQHKLRRTDSNLATRSYEFRLVHRDRSLKNILLTVDLIPGTKISVASLMDITDRKQAEEKLKKTSHDLQEIGFIVHKSPSIAFLWRAEENWPVEFVSENISQFGYSPDDFTSGRISYAHIIHPDDLERVVTEVAQYTEEGRTEFTQEYRLLTKTGKLRWIEDRTWVRRNEQGIVTHFQGIASDVTDRKQAEEALKRSEHLYRAIFENTGNAYILLDEDTKIIIANSEFEKLSGYSRNDIEGKKSWTEFVTDEYLPRMMQYHRSRRIDESAVPQKYEFQFIDKHKRVKDIVLSVDIIPGTRQSIISLHDITGLKQIEKTLRESQRRLADIIEFLPDATFVINNQGEVVAWNRAIETLTGVKKADMIGKGNQEYAIPFYGKRRPILIDYALEMDRKMEKQYTAIQKMGDIVLGEAFTPNLLPGNIHLSGTASVLRDENGKITAAIECIRDNTERKKLEERLNRAGKMEALGTMAGGVAHDLNNVLGIMVGYSELMQAELPAGSSLAKYAGNILQSSIRASAIIQDLLTLARRSVTVSEIVDLNKLVADYLNTPEFEKLQFCHPDIIIETKLEDNPLNIKGSPVHLSKTIMNLVSNAAEAISGKGKITIKTENRYLDKPIHGYDEMLEGDYTVLIVSDTGGGISVNDMNKIFEPFYTKKVMGRSGTGLGLAVVWGTVKDHKGYIDVQSEENMGTTFTLYLPATREEAAKIKETASPLDYKGKGEAILVVDDAKEQRELAVKMLTRLGYHVEAVAGGEDAVEYIKNKKSDLIVLDMIMDPGIDGLETYRRILEISPVQKAIIVSGFSETNRVKKAQELGAGEFVRKPYILEKMGLAVKNELHRK